MNGFFLSTVNPAECLPHRATGIIFGEPLKNSCPDLFLTHGMPQVNISGNRQIRGNHVWIFLEERSEFWIFRLNEAYRSFDQSRLFQDFLEFYGVGVSRVFGDPAVRKLHTWKLGNYAA